MVPVKKVFNNLKVIDQPTFSSDEDPDDLQLILSECQTLLDLDQKAEVKKEVYEVTKHPVILFQPELDGDDCQCVPNQSLSDNINKNGEKGYNNNNPILYHNLENLVPGNIIRNKGRDDLNNSEMSASCDSKQNKNWETPIPVSNPEVGTLVWAKMKGICYNGASYA